MGGVVCSWAVSLAWAAGDIPGTSSAVSNTSRVSCAWNVALVSDWRHRCQGLRVLLVDASFSIGGQLRDQEWGFDVEVAGELEVVLGDLLGDLA